MKINDENTFMRIFGNIDVEKFTGYGKTSELVEDLNSEWIKNYRKKNGIIKRACKRLGSMLGILSNPKIRKSVLSFEEEGEISKNTTTNQRFKTRPTTWIEDDFYISAPLPEKGGDYDNGDLGSIKCNYDIYQKATEINKLELINLIKSENDKYLAGKKPDVITL
jgi:hypothetical protein